MAPVDSVIRMAARLLHSSGVAMDQEFPVEVDEGLRWGLARIPQPGSTATRQVLVGVPASGRFTAEELASAIDDGRDDLLALEPDEELEIGSFRFEIY
ncbi:hypothetical protein ABIB25_003752 [Nakamurella sp. UYEF19]|uniref:hypothetical protein n=1 Tax=Nakamurella sp. UYEF19 TaxID=1756392 RepID=UPI00339756A2